MNIQKADAESELSAEVRDPGPDDAQVRLNPTEEMDDGHGVRMAELFASASAADCNKPEEFDVVTI